MGFTYNEVKTILGLGRWRPYLGALGYNALDYLLHVPGSTTPSCIHVNLNMEEKTAKISTGMMEHHTTIDTYINMLYSASDRHGMISFISSGFPTAPDRFNETIQPEAYLNLLNLRAM